MIIRADGSDYAVLQLWLDLLTAAQVYLVIQTP